MNPELTFTYFSRQNLARANRWHGGNGIIDWSISDWGVAAAGEMGEVCDAIKKLNRLRDGFTSNNPRQPQSTMAATDEILKEIGDTGVYLDLLAQRCGSTLGECMVRVFNAISERENMPERV